MGRLGFRCATLQDVVLRHAMGQSMPARTYCITFDDGFQNFHSKALPILEKHGLRATVFLVSDLVGKTNQWNECEGDVVEALMSLEEIVDARARGTDFGSHTRSHADLRASDDATAWNEIAGSRTALQDLLKDSIDLFCYPYGRFREATPEMVKRAGYAAGCSCLKGACTPETDAMLLPRINVRADTKPAILAYKLFRAVRLGR